MTSKRPTKHAIPDIVEAISGEVPATFTEEVLRRISAATFADRMQFTEALQQHKEGFSSLLQHMVNCYKALLAAESSCLSTVVAIIHLLTRRTSLRKFMPLCKNINTVAMPTRDALLGHFRKQMHHGRIAVTHSYLLCTLDNI